MANLKIKNFNELATDGLRRSALEIAEAGLAAIDTENVIKKLVVPKEDGFEIAGERLRRRQFGKIMAILVGKCAISAGEALEKILGDDIEKGIVFDVRPAPTFKKIRAFRGTHPSPSEANTAASAEIVETVKNSGEKDLVIFVISGGGSTLLCLPEDAGCEEEGKILRALTCAGAAIQEINTVRKHLSLARGGYLAKYAYPAKVVSLIFSDVPGNDIQFVASGPTVKDATTSAEAEAILAKYDILRVCGIDRCGLVETPKEDKYFEKVKNILAASNIAALEAMKKKAAESGFSATVKNDRLTGEAKNAASAIAAELQAAPAHSVLLYGGETTVVVKESSGRGGRNLELALAATSAIPAGQLIMAIASDGQDNGEYAGAIADSEARKKAEEFGLKAEDYLERHDSYGFYEKAGRCLLTGPTGSNVSDLIIAAKT